MIPRHAVDACDYLYGSRDTLLVVARLLEEGRVVELAQIHEFVLADAKRVESVVEWIHEEHIIGEVPTALTEA